MRDYYIGWDVGAWNCKTSSKSCDALVVLNENGFLEKEPFRGNIKGVLNESNSVEDFLYKLLDKCEITYTNQNVVLAIDAPLGYSDAFVKAKTPEERRTLRSKTFKGMAEAMAIQWTKFINNG